MSKAIAITRDYILVTGSEEVAVIVNLLLREEIGDAKSRADSLLEFDLNCDNIHCLSCEMIYRDRNRRFGTPDFPSWIYMNFGAARTASSRGNTILN